MKARWANTLFTVPAWALLALVVVAPLGTAVWLSLTDASLASIDPPVPVGLENYTTALGKGEFGSGLLSTVSVILASLVVQFPVGYLIAAALATRLRAVPFLRGVVAIPILMTPVAVGLIWKLLADPDLGLIRAIGAVVGLDRPNVFADPIAATALIVFVNSWINIPFVALMLLAGLLGLPDEVMEAAAMDGAGALQRTVRITLPMIAPVIATTAALRIMGDYRMFDLVYVLTRGGPGGATRNLSLLVYQESTVFFDIGRASAVAILMVLIVLPLFAFVARWSL